MPTIPPVGPIDCFRPSSSYATAGYSSAEPLRGFEGGWNRRAKACFRNAFLNAQKDAGRFAYCEGVGLSKFGPLPHAWFIDRSAPNLAIDTTWVDETACLYMGVCFKTNYAARIFQNEYFSLIDNWPMGWPLLTGEHAISEALEISL